MKEITYVGENLFIGNLGHFFVVLALISALFSALFYVRAKEEKCSERTIGRILFGIHTIAVFGIFITLFKIIQGHYFEYAYAYEHSSLDLPLRYMISCFWEGQEGSFLLWIVWNAILGVILVFTAKKWERGVLAIVALCQVVLTAMLLGVNFFDIYTLGSSPFELLRDKMHAPIFESANYLKNVVDGSGLNPLLQNYWMVIHPPTLFLGFALTIVPFAFAITSLFYKEHRAWIKPALPWALAGGMILGAGIIMGGFWAYESLSFGGYWAWDPVENASLIPWLLLISGIHLMLIKKVTNGSTIAAYTLVISTFIMVLYATFLTRSGVLGETSVHAFTDLGLAGQLMQFVVLFIWLPIIAVTEGAAKRWYMIIPVSILVLLLPFYTKLSFYPLLALTLAGLAWFVLNLNKQIKNHASEDNITGREFWMFIGSLMLALSAVQVLVGTSKPVFNKIFGTNLVPPEDVIAYYNMYQMPIAIVIALLMAVTQFFRYRSTPDKYKLAKEILITLGISVLLTVGGVYLFGISNPMYVIFMLAGIYVFFANLSYLVLYVRKLKLSGSSIAHMGFGLMLLGVLVSSAKKQVITRDMTGNMRNFDEQSRKENMLLVKGEENQLGDYSVSYIGDSVSINDVYFKVHYISSDSSEEFTLYPNGQFDDAGRMTSSNPDTRHYLTYDVYTHVTYKPLPPSDSVKWENVKEHIVVQGDSIITPNGVVYFTGIEKGDGASIGLKNTTLAKALIKIKRGDVILDAEPLFGINSQTFFSIRQDVLEAGLRFGFEIRASEDGGDPVAVLEIAETKPQPQYIVMKGIVFPYINFLWLGTVMMVIGFGIATWNRLELKRS
ncbi:MAG: cytochrome C biogenesis protein [Bacteroidetes bacterium]|nr:MAG: cytochrome C biogenesis protein [Bacteroidota bacterium]